MKRHVLLDIIETVLKISVFQKFLTNYTVLFVCNNNSFKILQVECNQSKSKEFRQNIECVENNITTAYNFMKIMYKIQRIYIYLHNAVHFSI